MNYFQTPERMKAEVAATLPQSFRQKRGNTWTRSNPVHDVDSFLEGPSFDLSGNLYFVDIPFGRIFQMDSLGEISLVTEYDGWPNGLKIDREGRIFVADYKRGLLLVDPNGGSIETVLDTRNSEQFKGLNDLCFASNGDLYFTDQGQTGWQDPTGRVYRLSANGRLDCLIDTVPSPNGLCLNLSETQLYLAVTRANAVWRLPLRSDGSVSKVGTFVQLSGGFAGPDGMALDQEGGLLVCHIGIGIWRFDARGIPTHLIESGVGTHMTNLCFGGSDNRVLYITEADSGSILRVTMPVPGQVLYSHH
jgi:gluconolactonase